MLEFQEKRKLKKFLYSRVALVILLILIAILVKAVWGVYEKQAVTRDNLAQTAASFKDLQAQADMLSSDIARLKTVAGTEAEIRDKYGLVKPGEEVIVVVDKSNDGSSSSTAAIGFWQGVWNWIH